MSALAAQLVVSQVGQKVYNCSVGECSRSITTAGCRGPHYDKASRSVVVIHVAIPQLYTSYTMFMCTLVSKGGKARNSSFLVTVMDARIYFTTFTGQTLQRLTKVTITQLITHTHIHIAVHVWLPLTVSLPRGY